jgi:predicted AAA+ superfamily ATPase
VASSPEYARLTAVPARSFFLFGVRGTGKSTWSRKALPGAYVVDLLDERRHQELLANPGLLALELGDLPTGSFVVLDEVQRVPALLNEVHRLIETRKLRFALLGSSARKLRAAGTNLLAGRALHKAMHPLTPKEMGRDFDLAGALRFGTLPIVVSAEDQRAVLESYVHLYVRQEIQAEALVRSLPGFVRFLPVAALFHGQVVNVSGLARDAGVARSTVEGYLEILEDTLLTIRLPAFEARLRARERRHPKLFWVDPGLVRSAKRQLGPVTAEEQGALFEGLVLHLLRAHGEEQELYEEIFYWASAQAQATEVDFLLRRGREYLAIEVKSQERFAMSMAAGLKAIGDLPGVVRRILAYRGARSLKTDNGIEVWPFERFAATVASGGLWP